MTAKYIYTYILIIKISRLSGGICPQIYVSKSATELNIPKTMNDINQNEKKKTITKKKPKHYIYIYINQAWIYLPICIHSWTQYTWNHEWHKPKKIIHSNIHANGDKQCQIIFMSNKSVLSSNFHINLK